MYNPTTPGYNTQNQTRFTPNYEPTISDNPYASSPYDLQNIPPPPKPPYAHKRLVLSLVMVIVALVIVFAGSVIWLQYATGSNKETQKPNDNFTTPISAPTIAQTSNPNYSAEDIVKDIRLAAREFLPDSSSGNNDLFTIYAWSGDRYKSDVPFTSSAGFGDYDACADGGTCVPPQADKGFSPSQIAIWVYATREDTVKAYNEIMNQISEGTWAGTPTPDPVVGIYPVAFMHGRCLMIGATGISIYGQVVTQDCI